MCPLCRWQTLEDLEKGLQLTPTLSVNAQVPDTREQGEREGCGSLFKQHLTARSQQAQALPVSKGTFVWTVSQWLSALMKSNLLKITGE